jgi:hypothetical protein
MTKTFHLVILPWALGLGACSSPAPHIAFNEEGKPRILKCTLRPNGQTLYSSNYIEAFPATVPAGSPAVVTHYTVQEVGLNLNKIDYQMRPTTAQFGTDPAVFIKKFFVNSDEELGLAKLEPSHRKNIENGIWQLGMTKEEIYAALGPPNWIDFGIDATNIPLEQIMDRNRWEYRDSDIMLSIWPIKRVFIFDGGKLQSANT